VVGEDEPEEVDVSAMGRNRFADNCGRERGEVIVFPRNERFGFGPSVFLIAC